ncbi:MAG: hypothetical protein VW378_03675 [bacterium]
MKNSLFFVFLLNFLFFSTSFSITLEKEALLKGSVRADYSLSIDSSQGGLDIGQINHSDVYQKLFAFIVSCNFPWGFSVTIHSENSGRLLRQYWDGSQWKEYAHHSTTDWVYGKGAEVPYYVSFELTNEGRLGLQDAGLNEVLPTTIETHYLYAVGSYPSKQLTSDLVMLFTDDGTLMGTVKEATVDKKINFWAYVPVLDSALLRGYYKDRLVITLSD